MSFAGQGRRLRFPNQQHLYDQITTLRFQLPKQVEYNGSRLSLPNQTYGTDFMTNNSLFQAIVKDPENDTPRLIYADWLEENGQPERAEFIRVQCEAARSPRFSPIWWELSERSEDLLAEHKEEWLPSLGFQFTNPVFERGFLSGLQMTTASFLTQAPRLFQKAPLARDICLERLGEKAFELKDCRHLRRLTGVSFDLRTNKENDWESVEQAVATISALDLPSLKRLRFPNASNRDEEIANALAANLNLTNVQELELSEPLLQGFPGRLFHSAVMSSVEKLRVRGDLQSTDVLGLLESPYKRGIRELAFIRMDAAPEQVLDFFTNSPRMSTLESLHARPNHLDDDFCATVLSSENLSNLYELSLSRVSGEQLSRAPFAPNLRRLRGWNVRNDFLKFFQPANGQCPRHITSLDANVIELTSEFVAALIDSGTLANLRELSLRGVRIHNKPLESLVSSPDAAHLMRLDLCQASVSYEGVKAIASSPYMSNLRVLNLYGCQRHDGIPQALADSSHLGKLRKVVIFDWQPRSNKPLWADILKQSQLPSLREVEILYTPKELES